jgi:GNAT superfamily N-acetyltransferase
MIQIKKMNECTFEESLTAWNDGFEGYFVNVRMDMQQFLQRMITEETAPHYSFIAFDGNKPVGLLLNGIRIIDGRKIAWNGGTAVAQSYRGKGIGRLLLERSLDLYEEEGVEVATLEAIKENENAISLYEKYGYHIKEHLLFLQHQGEMNGVTNSTELGDITFRRKLPIQLCDISYYDTYAPWQCQIDSVKNGNITELLKGGESAGYILYKENFNDTGKKQSIIIYQCHVNPSFELVQEQIIESLINDVCSLHNFDGMKMVFNIPKTNISVRSFKKLGFKESLEQVKMIKEM